MVFLSELARFRYFTYVFARFEAWLMLFKVYHYAQKTIQPELACESGSTENAPCIDCYFR